VPVVSEGIGFWRRFPLQLAGSDVLRGSFTVGMACTITIFPDIGPSSLRKQAYLLGGTGTILQYGYSTVR
jgi:hypothetical protein